MTKLRMGREASRVCATPVLDNLMLWLGLAKGWLHRSA